MRLEVFRPTWGFAAWPGAPFATVADCLPVVRERGYDGVEVALSFVPQPIELARAVDAAGLGLIHLAVLSGDSVEEHLAALRRDLALVAGVPHRFVNCHGGRDTWSEDEACRFYEGALSAAEAAGVAVAFETHRGRPTFNPWATVRICHRFPELLLTCDLSHWVVVCERLLDGDEELLEVAARQGHHIHARVAHEQGPQVNDPRAPEHHDLLVAHERWWDRIWQAQEARGMEASTLSPEWGPPPYQPTAPYTGEPLADLGAIVDWMAVRERARFEVRFGGGAGSRHR